MSKPSPHHLYPQRNARRKKIKKKNVLNVPEELLELSGSYNPISSLSKGSKSEKSSEYTKSPGKQSSISIKKKTINVPNKSLVTTPKVFEKIFFSDLLTDLQVNIMNRVLPNKYLLRHWIDKDKLDVRNLCKNPNAISFLKDIIDLPKDKYDALSIDKQIDWSILSGNPNAIYLIKKKLLEESKLTEKEYSELKVYQQINWDVLSSNPNAIDLLSKKILEEKVVSHLYIGSKIDWNLLSSNPNAISLLKENEEKIVFNSYCTNKNLDIELFQKLLTEKADGTEINWDKIWSVPNSKVIDILYKSYSHKIDYMNLTRNKCASAIKILLAYNGGNMGWYNLSSNTHSEIIKLLANDIKLINWIVLAENTNILAIKLIEDNISKINKFDIDYVWNNLSANPKAIKLLTKNFDKINLTALCANPNAVKLIKMHKDKLTSSHYKKLSENPCIFIEK